MNHNDQLSTLHDRIGAGIVKIGNGGILNVGKIGGKDLISYRTLPN